MKDKNNQLIVVLGMHRSGTSAITRGLQVLGVELGDQLIPSAVVNNEKGYWGNFDPNAWKIELLQTLENYSAKSLKMTRY